jgi:excisionase family DNA binding protein
VARLLEVSDQSIRRWVKAGELRAYKPKKEYRIAKSDLEAFLKERRVPLVQDRLLDFGEEPRTEWGAAVSSARQLRERAQARVEELLASWQESKNREEDPAERRPYLDEIGELLQEAYDAMPALFQAMSYERWPEQWPEVQEAEEFYRELWRLVEGAGLSIRTGNAQEERPKAVEESKAA